MAKPQLPTVCAGKFINRTVHPECAGCLYRVWPVPAHAYWMVTPDFDDTCPEKKEKTK